MLKKRQVKQWVVGILILSGISLLGATDALARDGHDRGARRTSHQQYGRRVNFPEHEAKIVFHGGRKYYYRDGLFHRWSPFGFVVIAPPIGAVVAELPFNVRIVISKGESYFYYDNIYYKRCPRGFVVVNPPYRVLEQPREVVAFKTGPQEDVAFSQNADSYIVNIPNAKGSYTAVTLKKSGNGYTGPQGEYYPEFPSVEQLKVMYGK